MNTNNKIFKSFVLILIVSISGGCASLYVKNGKEAYNELKYQDAIYFFEKGLAKKDDPEASRMLAQSYMLTNNYKKASEVFERTRLYTDNTDADRINQARMLMSLERYGEAKTILEGILSRDSNNTIAQELLMGCKKIEDLKRDSLVYTVEPVIIPNSFAAFSAYSYKDGLIFTSPSGKGDKDPYTGNVYTNLFFSKKEGASYSNPVELTGVNGKYHDAVAAVSPNGQTIIFTRSFQLNGGALAGNDQRVSNTQLYFSKAEGEGWSKPILVPICDSKYMFAHPAFSPDGSVLYFSSDMPGGQGGMDIWQTTYNDGSYGTPINLGTAINTKGDEVFPTVKGDDTIYFSSDGHVGLGGLDIHTSTKRNGEWSDAKPVSYPINTSNDDFSMIWNPDGKGGFISSDRTGADRIYSFVEDDIVINFSGLITGKDSMLPLGGARVIIKNLTDGTEQMVFTDGDGKFNAQLLKGKDYQILAELDGYFKTTDTFSTKTPMTGKNMEKVIELQELYVKSEIPDVTDNTNGNNGNNGNNGGKTKLQQGVYSIPDIHWDYNKWDVRPDAVPYLESLVKLFKDNKDLKFELRSHTDCRGGDEYNIDLSGKRAKAVLDYLVAKGVPRSIIVSKGYGEKELLNECSDGVYCTEEKHQENRRTEFVVTEKKK